MVTIVFKVVVLPPATQPASSEPPPTLKILAQPTDTFEQLWIGIRQCYYAGYSKLVRLRSDASELQNGDGADIDAADIVSDHYSEQTGKDGRSYMLRVCDSPDPGVPDHVSGQEHT